MRKALKLENSNHVAVIFGGESGSTYYLYYYTGRTCACKKLERGLIIRDLSNAEYVPRCFNSHVVFLISFRVHLACLNKQTFFFNYLDYFSYYLWTELHFFYTIHKSQCTISVTF